MSFEESVGYFRKSSLSRVASGGFRAGTIEAKLNALNIQDLDVDKTTGLILAIHNAGIPKDDVGARIAFSKQWIAENCE